MHFALKSLVLSGIIVLSMVLSAYASGAEDNDIDPRLVKVVETIKIQFAANSATNNENEEVFGFNEPFFVNANELIFSLYSRDPKKIILAAESFKSQADYDPSIDKDFIAEMYINFAEELSKTPEWISVENTALDYLGSDHWFEQFMGYRLSSVIYANKLENSHALSHAQKALSIIPLDDSQLSLFARVKSLNIIAELCNV